MHFSSLGAGDKHLSRYFGLALAALFACLLHVFTHQDAAAQENENKSSLTLEEAIRTALDKNPRISASRSRLDASDAKITQARSSLYPRIDFSETFMRTNNPAMAFSTRLNQEQITMQDFDPSRLKDRKSVV